MTFFCLVRMLGAAATPGLKLSVFNNTALAGLPLRTAVVPGAIARHDGHSPFSATLTGTLTGSPGFLLNFSCSFGGAALGYAHIDGHLICQTGVNVPHAPGGADVRSTAYDNPLPILSATALPVRFTIVHNGSDSSELSFGLTITQRQTHSNDPGQPVQLSALTPELSAVERQRDEMQTRLSQGWAPWYDMSFTRLVRLPEGSTLSLVLCEPAHSEIATIAAKCVTEARTDWAPSYGMPVDVRPGAHAVDRSFAQLYIATPTCNVSITMGGGQALLVTISVVSGCKDAEMVLLGSSAWQRLHEFHASSNAITFTPFGDHMRTSTIYSTVAASGHLQLPAEIDSQPHVALPLTQDIGLSSDQPKDLSSIQASLEAAWTREQQRYARYGAHAETKMAMQAGVMWNVIYNPLVSVIAPVIRGNPWGWDMGVVNDDWPFVLFDWDTHFAAYMLSLDAMELSYSVLIQVLKGKTAKGFVPNGCAPTRKSTHSQPPVGAPVLLEIYKRYGDKWLVELLFNDLLDWSNWWYTNRRLEPLNITALGGDDMQAARYESGLDNSPMYDGEFFVPNAPDGYGLMQLYDVGMASMVAASDEALATLSEIVNRSEHAIMLRSRAKEERDKIANHLYDDESGTYCNRFPNGTFYRRFSPTTFYPLMAGAATGSRATKMMTNWLLNASRFCVSPSGDFHGNYESCYWGLPSISADDPAFPQLGYWRGFVWGPMALLTYWSLRHPDYVELDVVAKARKALCSQMEQLFLSQWRRHHHVCENFSPKRNATECTGMHFYHWGGLAGLIVLLEAGY